MPMICCSKSRWVKSMSAAMAIAGIAGALIMGPGTTALAQGQAGQQVQTGQPRPTTGQAGANGNAGGASFWAEENIMVVARSGAGLAGAARYCVLDEDMVDEFITKTEGRIAALARDEFEKVVARLEFKNLLAATSATAPREGCDTFASRFSSIARALP